MFWASRNTFDHKKNDLPIASSRLRPKRSAVSQRNIQENKKTIFTVVGIIFLIIYLMSSSGSDNENSNNNNNGALRSSKEKFINERPSASDDTHEVYNVKAGSITRVTGTEDNVMANKEEEEGEQGEGEEQKDSNDYGIEYYDLNQYQGMGEDPKSDGDIVLLCIPLRNADKVLPLMFRNMMNMTYPHSQIDISFLVSDCTDDGATIDTLFEYSQALQEGNLLQLLDEKEIQLQKSDVKGTSDLYLKYMPQDYMDNLKTAYSPPYHEEYTKPFRSIQIYKKDFGQIIGQGFSDRHDLKVQGIRRKLMGRARNWLISMSLKPYHSWVYWRDADIETSPGEILEDMMKYRSEFDVIVPNVWRPLPTFLGSEQPYDLNSWMESDAGLELAKSLNEDDVIVEGYVEYPTWRVHLAYIRDINGDQNEVVDLDGVGGVSILAKAKVFRGGTNFPAFTFANHAETEAFGILSRKNGFRVGGLPHYTIWHIYEPSEDDLLEISRLERKKRRQSV